MSRIDQAWRRAADSPAAEQQADPFKLDEYPRERPSASDGGNRVRGERDFAPVPSSRTGMPAVHDTTLRADTQPRAASSAAPAPRLTPFPAAGTGHHARLAAPPDLTAKAGSEITHQCRRLAGVLHNRQLERGLKTLVVTSAVETKDKTLTAVNLALTLTKTYANRVLLIDADVRPPFVHELIGADTEIGLSEVLRGGRREIPLIEVSPLLHLVPVGSEIPDAPVELASARMLAIVDECAARYDWVVLNTPAMSLISEAHVLARLTQGVVFVIGASTPFPVVEGAIAELGRDCILGTVLLGLKEPC